MFHFFNKVEKYITFRNNLKDQMGIVPTMGNLHQGHLSLIEKALDSVNNVTITIFVNPKQFGPNEDFDRYPRTIEKDIEKIKKLLSNYQNKNLLVLAPDSIKEIYPPHFSNEIKIRKMDKTLCAQFRPGHFDGVTTVVHRLFQIIHPSDAWFGQKDYQQFKILEQMVKELNLPIHMHALPIIREHDGLALSSRNQYLNKEDRNKALILSATIERMKNTILKIGLLEGQLECQKTIKIDQNWQYLEVLDAYDLEQPRNTSKEILIAGAYLIGTIRLIDNTLLSLNHA